MGLKLRIWRTLINTGTSLNRVKFCPKLIQLRILIFLALLNARI
jgi:hypothetical protein